MYAVIESGGKQHRVETGETVRLEKLDAPEGESVTFDKVMMIGDGADMQIGTPLVEGGSVTAEVISHGRGDKIRIIKIKRRKHSRKQANHRQWFTEVRIKEITKGQSVAHSKVSPVEKTKGQSVAHSKVSPVANTKG